MDGVFKVLSKRQIDPLPAASHVRQRTRSQPQAVVYGHAPSPAAREFKLAPAPPREEWERRKVARRTVAPAKTNAPTHVHATLRRVPARPLRQGVDAPEKRAELERRQERSEVYQPQYHSQSLPRQRTPSTHDNNLSSHAGPVDQVSTEATLWVIPPMDRLCHYESASESIHDCRILPGPAVHRPLMRQASQPALRVAERTLLSHHVYKPLPPVPPPVPPLPVWYVPDAQASRPAEEPVGYGRTQVPCGSSRTMPVTYRR